MIQRLDAFLLSIPQKALCAGLFVSIPVIGFIDWRLGSEMSFSILYLIFLSAGSWYLGKKIGLGLSLESVALLFIVDLMAQGNGNFHIFAAFINSVIHLSFFIVFVTIIIELKERLKDEEQLADTDFLTGLANSRRFYELIQAEMARANRYQRPFTVMYIDLDNFKTINDTFGHDSGDEVLQLVAGTIKQVTRQTDTIARLGGDEFTGLFPETGYDAAASVLYKIQTAVLDKMKTQQLPVTISMGAVTYETPRESPRLILKEVDSLVYQVKRAGKNAIIHIRVE